MIVLIDVGGRCHLWLLGVDVGVIRIQGESTDDGLRYAATSNLLCNMIRHCLVLVLKLMHNASKRRLATRLRNNLSARFLLNESTETYRQTNKCVVRTVQVQV